MLHRDLVKPLRKADPTRGYVSRLGDALRSELCFQILDNFTKQQIHGNHHK